MMLRLLDDLPEGLDSKYRLVIIAAKRSKQIQRGALPLVNSKSLKPISIALDEVFSGKVKFEAPSSECEGREIKQGTQEVRGAWFRHIPPEELILEEALVSEEEKGVSGGLEAEEEGEEFQAEMEEEQEGVLEEGMVEFAPISEVGLDAEIPEMEIEHEGEAED